MDKVIGRQSGNRYRNEIRSGTRTAFAGNRQKRAPMRQNGRRKTDQSFQTNTKARKNPIPPLAKENIRIIPLGGVEEIGRNLTAIEYGEDIVVIDVGLQFRDEETPGIDYILPNTTYLEERKNKIRGVFITHGHLDHIGGIPYILHRIGNPPIYSRRLTTMMIKKRQEEFPHLPPLDVKEVEKNQTVTAGNLKIRFFAVSHTIPDSMGIIIETPYGPIVVTGDLKLDHVEGEPTDEEKEVFRKFEKEKVLLMIADSTNVEKPGFSIPESVVRENIKKIIKETDGRLIIGTFASQLERLISIIEAAESFNKKVVVEGRSMKQNIEIVRELKMLKVKKETIISLEEMENYPPDKVVVLATGAQGDEFAALMRMAMKTHKHFRITPRDTVLLSSSIIPGNETAVQKLKDNIARQGATIVHYRISEVHSSGHSNREEIAWVHKHVKPKFFIPVHGHHYMLRVHAKLAEELGMSPANIVVPDNGMVIEIQDRGEKIVALKEKAPSSMIMVDGFSTGDLQEVVIRDRQMLSQDGMFVIIASINPVTGKLRKSPDIISRGFIYLRESQELLHKTRLLVKKTVEESAVGMHPINFDYIKSNVADTVGRYLFQKTAKKPIVIPVIIGV